MTRRSNISILSLVILFMAMVAQFHCHDSDICVDDNLRETHSCHLNPQTFVFTGRSPLSDIAIASVALPCQDGGESLVPAPCEREILQDGVKTHKISVVTIISGDYILRGPPSAA